jgi:hypothetical protein
MLAGQGGEERACAHTPLPLCAVYMHAYTQLAAHACSTPQQNHAHVQLVCRHLPLEDLRSARLASASWCSAASSTVRVVQYSIEEDPLHEVIAAFPHVTHVICQRGPPSVYRHWTNGSVVLLAADEQPAGEQQRTWYQKQWRVVIKPWGPACADSASQGLRYWHDRLPVVGSSASILAPAEAPLAPQVGGTLEHSAAASVRDVV